MGHTLLALLFACVIGIVVSFAVYILIRTVGVSKTKSKLETTNTSDDVRIWTEVSELSEDSTTTENEESQPTVYDTATSNAQTATGNYDSITGTESWISGYTTSRSIPRRFRDSLKYDFRTLWNSGVRYVDLIVTNKEMLLESTDDVEIGAIGFVSENREYYVKMPNNQWRKFSHATEYDLKYELDKWVYDTLKNVEDDLL